VAKAKDEHVDAFEKALKAIKSDVAGFKSNPKSKVPELDQRAADAFQAMSTTELTTLVEADESMKRVGYEVKAEASTARVRMV
jgi:hypothetical protein